MYKYSILVEPLLDLSCQTLFITGCSLFFLVFFLKPPKCSFFICCLVPHFHYTLQENNAVTNMMIWKKKNEKDHWHKWGRGVCFGDDTVVNWERRTRWEKQSPLPTRSFLLQVELIQLVTALLFQHQMWHVEFIYRQDSMFGFNFYFTLSFKKFDLCRSKICGVERGENFEL